MAYCTLADLLEQIASEDLVGLTDDMGLGAVSSAVVDRAIADADATIDAWLQARYTVPFTVVPPIIRKASVDMAIVSLYSRRGIDPPEIRLAMEREARRFIEKAAAGAVSLGVSTTKSTESGRYVSAPDAVFGADTLDLF